MSSCARRMCSSELPRRMLEAGRASAALVGRNPVDRLVEPDVRLLPVEQTRRDDRGARSRSILASASLISAVDRIRQPHTGTSRRVPAERPRPAPSPRCGPPAARRYPCRARRGWSHTARSSRCSDRCRPAGTAGSSFMSVSQSVSDRRSVSAPTVSPWTTTANTRPARCRGYAHPFSSSAFASSDLLPVRRRLIGIAAVRAHQAVDHQLQHARRLIPVDGRDDHHAVRSHPARIELVHPVDAPVPWRDWDSRSTASGRAASPWRRTPCTEESDGRTAR